MTVQEEMAQIEGRLHGAGLSVSDVCKEADVARSTWQRWKSGATEPNIKTWRIVTEAADKLAPATISDTV